jgi:hypothetical protein
MKLKVFGTIISHLVNLGITSPKQEEQPNIKQNGAYVIL